MPACQHVVSTTSTTATSNMQCSFPFTVHTTGSHTSERCVVNESADCDEKISLQDWSGQLSYIGFFSPGAFPRPSMFSYSVPLAITRQKPLVLSWAIDPNCYQLRGSAWNSCICRRRRPFRYETPPLCKWSSNAKLSLNSQKVQIFLKNGIGGKWGKRWVDDVFDKFLYFFMKNIIVCFFRHTLVGE